MKRSIFLWALAIATPIQANAEELLVRVSGLESTEGNIVACLWTSNDGFPICGSDSQDITSVPAAEGAQLAFTGLAEGVYAVTAFHDIDGDGEIRRGFGGRPLEPVGLSNNPARRMARPKFETAAVTLVGRTEIEIQLR
ncbi:MAG: DUF2141 domain-containing protein [Henriciella sp.]|nr:DUF2141 domain-containing protein [Henriciella sp.]